MPKMKTNRGAAKRFKKTASGGFKRSQGHRRHILSLTEKLKDFIEALRKNASELRA